MPRKRGQDEEIILFAMKVVGPVAAFFIVAIATDATHLVQWASSGPMDTAVYAISDLADFIFRSPL